MAALFLTYLSNKVCEFGLTMVRIVAGRNACTNLVPRVDERPWERGCACTWIFPTSSPVLFIWKSPPFPPEV